GVAVHGELVDEFRAGEFDRLDVGGGQRAGSCIGHRLAPARSEKKACMSRATSSGSSHSRKWPPLGVVLKRTTLCERSAHSRGAGGNMSFSLIRNATGTPTRLVLPRLRTIS